MKQHNEIIGKMMTEMDRMQDLVDLNKDPTPSEIEVIMERVGEYLNDSEVITNPIDRQFTKRAIEKELGGVIESNLLFRASRDGWTPSDFHRFCDDKGTTLVLIKTSKDKICGGLTTVPWGTSGGYVPMKEFDHCFLFSLETRAVYNVQDRQNAVWH